MALLVYSAWSPPTLLSVSLLCHLHSSLLLLAQLEDGGCYYPLHAFPGLDPEVRAPNTEPSHCAEVGIGEAFSSLLGGDEEVKSRAFA